MGFIAEIIDFLLKQWKFFIAQRAKMFMLYLVSLFFFPNIVLSYF